MYKRQPELVGVKSNSLPLGKLSGRHAFVEKLKELELDFVEEDIKPLFAKFKVLAGKKHDITDADIRALVAGTSVDNPEGFHFQDLRLTTNADETITATVSLVNEDGLSLIHISFSIICRAFHFYCTKQSSVIKDY